MKEVEAKVPENYEELTKLLTNFQKYEKKTEKIIKKWNKIDSKIKNVLQEIESKIKSHESNYAEWTEEDVVIWISSLEEGKYAQKYKLKPDRHLKGEKFDYDAKIIKEGLVDVGVRDEEDRDNIVEAAQKIVQNGKGLTLSC